MGKHSETNEFNEFKDEFSKLLRNFFGETKMDGCEYDFLPPLDVFEEDNYLIIELEIPGVEKDGIEISFANKVLTIFGEKKTRLDKEKLNFFRIERSSGKFHRKIDIEHNIDEESINAELVNGVLKISLPIVDEINKKTINIK